MLFDRLLSKRGSTPIDSDVGWNYMSGGLQTQAGVRINEQTALSIAAVWAATHNISEDISKLGLPLYRFTDPERQNREKVYDHPLYAILNEAPNAEMSAMTFRETLTAHLMGYGNAYAEIIRTGSGEVKRLEILEPQKMEVRRVDEKIVYKYDGSTVLPARKVLHVKGLGYNGLMGYSVVRMARESLGLAKAAEGFGAAMFGNNCQPGLVAVHPETMSEQAEQNLRRTLERAGKGENAFKVLVLEEGLKLDKLAITPEDAQYLSTRNFEIEEVCRWFRIPPSKIHHLLKANFNTLEMQSLEYVTDTLMGWCVRWEKEIKRQLLNQPGDRDLYVEHNLDALLRGDIKTRAESYAKGRQWGWFSVNDIRKKENMPPIGEAGDVYLSPGNMMDVKNMDQMMPTPAPQPVPAPEPDDDDDEEDDQDDEERKVEAIDRALWRSIESAMGRLCRIEEDKIARAGKRNDFDDWMKGFVISHEEYVWSALNDAVRNITPLYYAHGRKIDEAELTARICTSHLKRLGKWNLESEPEAEVIHNAIKELRK
jgi:HK97 family phage portal protein